MIPVFSENNNLTESLSDSDVKSILAPRLLSAKHISRSDVINPPDATSCPALILSSLIKFCIVLNTFFKK